MNSATPPLITIVVPSYNQGRYLNQALTSIFAQEIAVEVFVMDGGSNDDSVEIIRTWEPRLAGWRSSRDQGQAAAINEGIARGSAPFVSWLNSDDWLLPGGLRALLDGCMKRPEAPAVYGRAFHHSQASGRSSTVWVESFSERRLALRCIVCQPATLIRRASWESVGGLNSDLSMAMDYDLWWRLFKAFGALSYIEKEVAVNRNHADTKTNTRRRLHYREAMDVVRRHNGSVPLKWWLAQPYSVWFKSLMNR